MRELVFLILGAGAGAFFAIEATKHRWWAPGALEHYKRLQDEVRAWEIHNARRNDEAFQRYTSPVSSTSRGEVHVPGVVSNRELIDHSSEECPNFPGCHCANHCCDGWMHPCPEDGPVPSKNRGAE